MDDLKPRTLYMVHMREDAPWDEYLRWSKDGWDEWREARPEEITLEAMVDLLDWDAESLNAHDFVTTHRALGALLVQEIGRDVTTKVFRRLIDFGGLHGFTDIGGGTNMKVHEKVLDVSLRCWPEKWQFKEPKQA